MRLLHRSIMIFCWAGLGLMPWPCLHAQNGGEFEDMPVEEVGPMMPSTLPRDASLELPEWRLEDLREFDFNNAPINLGGGLWPAEIWPLMPVPKRLPALQGNQLAPALSLPTEGELLEPLPPALRELYFGVLPPESVVDPQSLLNEVQQEDLCRFFEEYAVRQAGVQVRVLVIGGKQEMPPAAQIQALTNRWFPHQQGLVVVYPMGQPKAAACYFSEGLQLVYTADQLNTVRDACAKEATFATREEDQLSRYGIKLAVRMNRLREEPKPAPPAIVAAAPPESLLQNRWMLLALSSLLAVAMFLPLVLALRRRSKKAAQPDVWLLPDQEMTTRLNAPHCGGTMAVLKFR